MRCTHLSIYRLPGWTRKVTLSRLVRKAGYKRNVDRAFLAGVQVRLPRQLAKLGLDEPVPPKSVLVCGLTPRWTERQKATFDDLPGFPLSPDPLKRASETRLRREPIIVTPAVHQEKAALSPGSLVTDALHVSKGYLSRLGPKAYTPYIISLWCGRISYRYSKNTAVVDT